MPRQPPEESASQASPDCLGEHTALRLAQGQLEAEDFLIAEAHLDVCEPCRKVAAETAHFLEADLPSGVGPTSGPSQDDTERAGELAFAAWATLAPGTTIGRYRIQGLLGRGGMGIVYAAYDPELDRPVAIKLMRTEAPDQAVLAKQREAILCEARAMARLAHPNVVTVHDAGTVGDQVFLAMELIPGTTLARWLREEPRSWREIVRAFLSAGAGLAAAHSANVVHRDFKPANVLVGTDGRLCVTDFGLARPTPAETPDPGFATPAALSASPLAESSATTFAGTPAYMAPEQLRCERSNAKTDQFAFCVALYEGLYGERPFAGQTPAEYARNVLLGRTREAPPRSPVPSGLRHILLRGLSVTAEDRHPSMEALLAALTSDLIKKRASLRIAMGLTGLAGLLLAVLAFHAPTPRCRSATDRINQSWNETRKAAVYARFIQVGPPGADQVWRRTARLLGNYATSLQALYTQACRQGDVSGSHDSRASCLDRRLRDFEALTGLLATANGEVVQNAVKATEALSSLESCEKAGRRIEPSAEKGRIVEIETVRVKLAGIRALERAGRFADALAGAQAAAQAAARLGYRPLEAEALYLLGTLQVDAGDTRATEQTFEQAVQAAEAGHDDETAAHAWNQLAWIALFRGELAQVEKYTAHVAAAIERLGGDSVLEAKLQNTLGTLHQARGELEQAAKRFTEAIAMRERAKNPSFGDLASYQNNLGIVLTYLARYDEALEHLQHALRLRELASGPNHHFVAGTLGQIAQVHLAQGRYAEASSYANRSLHMLEELLGSKSFRVANAHTTVARILLRQGQYDQALVHEDRALAIMEGSLGKENAETAVCINIKGMALEGLGRYRDAAAQYRHALAIWQKVNPEHRNQSGPLDNLGNLAIVQAQWGRARGLFERSLALLDKTGSLDHPDRAYPLTGLGEALLGLQEPGRAIAPLEQALALRPEGSTHPPEAAQTAFALARALWQSGRDRTRGTLLAGRAYETAAGAGPAGTSLATKIEAWLRARGLDPGTQAQLRAPGRAAGL